jgi:hypothetical protein
MPYIASTSVIVPGPTTTTILPAQRLGPINPTTGQTVFTLTSTPTDANTVEVDVNGQSFSPGSGAFTTAGTTITWTGGFSLESTDTVIITWT